MQAQQSRGFPVGIAEHDEHRRMGDPPVEETCEQPTFFFERRSCHQPRLSSLVPCNKKTVRTIVPCKEYASCPRRWKIKSRRLHSDVRNSTGKLCSVSDHPGHLEKPLRPTLVTREGDGPCAAMRIRIPCAWSWSAPMGVSVRCFLLCPRAFIPNLVPLGNVLVHTRPQKRTPAPRADPRAAASVEASTSLSAPVHLCGALRPELAPTAEESATCPCVLTLAVAAQRRLLRRPSTR